MDNQSTILIIDDTKTNLDILLELLGNEYAVVPVLSGHLALEVLKQIDVDLILLDIVMPDIDGFELCRRLKSNPNTKDIPVIFITSKEDDASIEKAYDVGAMDYITRPFKFKEVQSRVKMQLKLKKTIRHLEYISSHDQLTGVYNRRKFFQLANDKFRNQKENLYAVMIDIDNFKAINDTYGHPIGDKVIKSVADVIDTLNPVNSVLGRLGGEEFALILNEENEIVLSQTIERIRKDIEQTYIATKMGDKIFVTISIGISKYSKDFKSIDDFLEDSDSALYDAKGEGRNRSIFRGINIPIDEKVSVLSMVAQ